MNATGGSAWLGQSLVGLVAAALALCLAGCGGSGKPGGAADQSLGVKLCWYNDDPYGGGTSSLTVKYPPGSCHAEQNWQGMGAEPVGKFEMMLAPAQLEELRAAVKKAIEGLKAGYPPPSPAMPIGPGADYYLRLACGGARAGVSGPNNDAYIPEPVRPLYCTGRPPGLLNNLYEATLKHPLSVIGLSVAPDKASYRIGEPIRLTLTVRSVGREPVAFTPMGCRDVVDGLITVTGQLPNGEQVLAEDFPFGSSEPPAWEPLTPAARRDLRLVRVLSPGDTYAFRLPPVAAPELPGRLTVRVSLKVSPRYHLSMLLYYVGAVVATGKWQDTCEVLVSR